MLHEDHAMMEIDKSKLNTKSIINMSNLLRKRHKNIASKNKIPEI